jgi:hypothetical protein
VVAHDARLGAEVEKPDGVVWTGDCREELAALEVFDRKAAASLQSSGAGTAVLASKLLEQEHGIISVYKEWEATDPDDHRPNPESSCARSLEEHGRRSGDGVTNALVLRPIAG